MQSHGCEIVHSNHAPTGTFRRFEGGTARAPVSSLGDALHVFVGDGWLRAIARHGSSCAADDACGRAGIIGVVGGYLAWRRSVEIEKWLHSRR
jgi:hypothetical protein